MSVPGPSVQCNGHLPQYPQNSVPSSFPLVKKELNSVASSLLPHFCFRNPLTFAAHSLPFSFELYPCTMEEAADLCLEPETCDLQDT